MKYILTIITLVWCSLFANAGDFIGASDFSVGGIYYAITSSNTVGVARPSLYGNCYSGSVIIPETVNYGGTTYTVTSIEDGAFYNCSSSSLHLIVIPKTVTKIEDGALYSNYDAVVILSEYVEFTYRTYAKKYYVPNTTKFSYKNGSYTNSFTINNISDIYSKNNTTSFIYQGSPINTENLWIKNNLSSFFSIVDYEMSENELYQDVGSYTGHVKISTSLGFEYIQDFTYNISPALLSIQIDNVSREYGEDNPILTYSTISGFVNGETLESIGGTVELSTSAKKISNVGTYDITSSVINANNYTTNSKGTLTIYQAPISIVCKNANREYGVSNPNFTYSILGLKNNDTEIYAFSVKPIISCDATLESNVGEYVISASGGTANNYNIIQYDNGVLTITKAPLTLTANNTQREYYSPNPDFTFTLVGLRNGDDKSCFSQLPSYNCSASLNSNCGEYSIEPTNAIAQNYSFIYKNGTLTITPATLKLTAQNCSREYGEENPIFQFSAEGFKGSDNTQNSLVTQPKLGTTATPNSNSGDYAITISGATSNNYKFIYVSGVLTIEKAPLKIIADNVERIYGDPNPTFTRTYIGFKMLDTETSAFSSLPRTSCTATKNSDAGEYVINIERGTSRNYIITEYQNGILTITKAPLILTATNKSRLYYETNPIFDFTLTGLKNGDTKSCVSTLPTYGCTAELTSNVGEYSIIPRNAFAKNYTFEYINGTLIVNPRPLIASVGNYSRKYRIENPSFEITYTGFVNNEDATILNQLSVASCSATISSDVGSYPITVSGGSATNYIITNYNNGVLKIEKADQTIIWNQDLSNIELYSQVELDATSSSGLPISYELSPNNVATLYTNAGKWYIDCYGCGATNIRAIQNGDRNYNESNIISKTLIVTGGGDDPQNPQIYLNIEEPGTLSTMIADNRKYQIKNLRLTGYINGTDICFLREMSGSDSNGNPTPGVLESLDISGCTIVRGGRSYYKSSRTTDYVVGDYMFYNCKVLTTLHIPNNSILIGNSSFADCDRLSVISIPNSVKKIGTEAFKNDISLMRIPMPEALTTIEDLAFTGCNSLTELNIPSEVSVIGDGIVKDCQNIERISVESDNSYFASVDGVLFNKDRDKLIIFPVNHFSNEYIVAEGVKTIAPFAFVNSKKLKTVNLPSSMSIIGKDAFIGCVNLQILKVQAIAPPVCQNDCFESISKTRCELQVPMGCRSSYWVTPVWSEFNKIVETDFSGIDSVYYDDMHIEIINGKIAISGCPIDVIVRIYQINGILLYQSEVSANGVEFEPSSRGVYLVVIGNKTYKVTF